MTSPERYDFCEIYARATSDDLVGRVAEIVSYGANATGTIDTPSVSFHVRRNPDRDRDLTKHFLVWPGMIDVYRKPGADAVSVVDAVCRLLTALWAAGIDAVAACDFEDELPFSGGIQRLGPGDIPAP